VEKPVNKLRIVRAGPDQARLLDRVDPGVFDAPIVPERLAACLAAPHHLMVLALDGELVVGMTTAMIHLHADRVTELYIDEVGTAGPWRRRGIARMMLEEMMAWGRERGCQDIWVGAETDNAPARALYARYAEPTNCVIYSWDPPSA